METPLKSAWFTVLPENPEHFLFGGANRPVASDSGVVSAIEILRQLSLRNSDQFFAFH